MSKSQPTYQPACLVRKQFEVSISTLRRWAEKGVVRFVRCGINGKRLYHIADLHRHLGVTEEESDQEERQTEKIIYTRVSSSRQKEDLQRQIQDLQTAFPEHSVISDIGSGLNFKRKGLSSLLDRVLQGLVKEVVVMHKDMLCRYRSELMEFVFKKAGTRFVVHGQDPESNNTRELADDLLAITIVFVARHNGQHSAANRRRRKRAAGQQQGDGRA
jgi:predicted site-specific integrase-resolvase